VILLTGDSMIKERCPLCGARGRVWHKRPEVFRCPSCMSVYSEFGFIVESGRELPEMWS
jgi:hypothetical protein